MGKLRFRIEEKKHTKLVFEVSGRGGLGEGMRVLPEKNEDWRKLWLFLAEHIFKTGFLNPFGTETIFCYCDVLKF